MPCLNQNQFGLLLADDLPAPERAALETHVEHCTLCQQTLERLTEDSVVRPNPWTGSSAHLAMLGLPGAYPDDGLTTSDLNASQDRETPFPGEEELLLSLSPSVTPGALGKLGDYEILGVIGRGGMGAVLRGLDPVLMRVVAVKMLRPHLLASSNAQKRFEREARAAAAVTHDNVVIIHAVGKEKGVLYLVMQFVDGPSLEERLQQGTPLTIDEIIRIGKEIAAGLGAAHARGLVHRDVKPANILMEAQTGRVKVSDFGLARAVDDGSLSRAGVLAGTPLYMSPEQANGEPVDARSDLFSLGTLLYTLCTGKPPFQADSTLAILRRVCDWAPPPIRESNPAVPAWLEAVVTRLMAKDPAQRYQSAGEVVEALQRPVTGVPSVEPVTRIASPPVTRRPWRWAVLGLLALGMLGGSFAVAWFALERMKQVSSGEPPHPVNPGPVILDREHPKGPLPATFKNRFGIEFVRVPRGKAWLGGGNGKPGTEEEEIPYDFYLGKCEVTQEQWQAVMGTNPSFFSRTGEGKIAVKDVSDEELKRFPVENVSCHDIDAFMDKLNADETDATWQFCRPLDKEWEYACRGGPMADRSVSAFSFYLAKPSQTLLPSQAHFKHANSLQHPLPVGTFEPNCLGLYDMHGNVAEWCDSDQLSPHGKPGPVSSGGSWSVGVKLCQASSQQSNAPPARLNTIGLRVARVYVGKTK